jgi:hypothetical protein
MYYRVGIFLSSIRYLSFFVCAFIYCIAICSNPDDSLKLKKDAPQFRLGGLPSIYYTPETNLGFGGFVYTFFKFNKQDTLCKQSITESFLSYTLNKQFAIENDFQIWLKQNKFFISGA